MAFWIPFVEIKTSTGKPLRQGNVTITPQAQSFVVKFPYGGFVWNRPVAVFVTRNGRRERFPIFDVTRTVIIATVGTGVLLSLATVLAGLLARSAARDRSKEV